MKVEELEKYGARFEMPKEAVKEQFKIMLKALRKKFGFWGMLGVFKDMYFIQGKLRKEHPETQNKVAAMGDVNEKELFMLFPFQRAEKAGNVHFYFQDKLKLPTKLLKFTFVGNYVELWNNNITLRFNIGE